MTWPGTPKFKKRKQYVGTYWLDCRHGIRYNTLYQITHVTKSGRAVLVNLAGGLVRAWLCEFQSFSWRFVCRPRPVLGAAYQKSDGSLYRVTALDIYQIHLECFQLGPLVVIDPLAHYHRIKVEYQSFFDDYTIALSAGLNYQNASQLAALNEEMFVRIERIINPNHVPVIEPVVAEPIPEPEPEIVRKSAWERLESDALEAVGEA